MVRPDLSVKFCGLTFRNPIVASSAPPTWGAKSIKKCIEAGIGGIVTKTITVQGSPEPRPRLAVLKIGNTVYGMENVESYSSFPADRWIKQELPEVFKIARKEEVPVIASITAPTPEEFADLAKKIAETGVDMLELNHSCAHASSATFGKGPIIPGCDPALEKKYLKPVREAVSIPISPKLTSNIQTMFTVQVAKAAKESGADAVTAVNTGNCVLGIDIETAKPILPSHGGYSGPAMKPISLNHISEIAANVDIPISGAGGAWSWRDIIEFMMAGASNVQICTVLMWKGVGEVKAMLSAIEKWVEGKGLTKLDSVIGKAVPNILPTAEFHKIPVENIFAHVDESKCNLCGKCIPACMWEALNITDRLNIDSGLCTGCGMCTQVCPTYALSVR